MADDVFTQQNPVYYVGTRAQPQNSPAFIAALASVLDALLAQSSANGGTLVTKTLNLTAQIGASFVESPLFAAGAVALCGHRMGT